MFYSTYQDSSDELSDEYERFKSFVKNQMMTFSVLTSYGQRKWDLKFLRKNEDQTTILNSSGGNSQDEEDISTKQSPHVWVTNKLFSTQK